MYVTQRCVLWILCGLVSCRGRTLACSDWNAIGRWWWMGGVGNRLTIKHIFTVIVRFPYLFWLWFWTNILQMCRFKNWNCWHRVYRVILWQLWCYITARDGSIVIDDILMHWTPKTASTGTWTTIIVYFSAILKGEGTFRFNSGAKHMLQHESSCLNTEGMCRWCLTGYSCQNLKEISYQRTNTPWTIKDE